MPSKRVKQAPSHRTRVSLPLALAEKLDGLRGAVRLLSGRRLTWAEIWVAGADELERQLRVEAERRGMDWDRLAATGLALDRGSRGAKKAGDAPEVTPPA